MHNVTKINPRFILCLHVIQAALSICWIDYTSIRMDIDYIWLGVGHGHLVHPAGASSADKTRRRVIAGRQPDHASANRRRKLVQWREAGVVVIHVGTVPV